MFTKQMLILTSSLSCTLMYAALPFHAAKKSVPRELFFNTKILAKHTTMNRLLKHEGFTEGYFLTPDKLRINYLLRTCPDARCNVICCAGWFPGRKEGIATLYALLPEHCNILFFDARGHGTSEGPMFSRIWEYGVHEHKDVLGALSFMKQHNNLPTVLWGICAGAFHASHAMINLHVRNALDRFNVKGLIFDSGWASVHKASHSALLAFLQEQARACIGKLLKKHKNHPHVQKQPITKATQALIKTIFTAGHSLLFKPFCKRYEKKTTLVNKMHLLKKPVFFIHAHDDCYVPINEVQKLAATTPHATNWWIDKPSKHACHHLKHKDAYKQRLHKFIDQIIA